jgi:hypothetical protein
VVSITQAVFNFSKGQPGGLIRSEKISLRLGIEPVTSALAGECSTYSLTVLSKFDITRHCKKGIFLVLILRGYMDKFFNFLISQPRKFIFDSYYVGGLK